MMGVGIVTQMTIKIDGQLLAWHHDMPEHYKIRQPYRVWVSPIGSPFPERLSKRHLFSESQLDIMYYGALSQYIDRGEV